MMHQNNKIILVTGGAGFIGSNLCHFLVNNHFSVLCLDNFDDFYAKEIKLNNISELLKNSFFQLIQGDIRDCQILNVIFATHKITTVIHLAAKAGVRNSIINPHDYFDTNVNGSLVLLEAMKNNGVKNLIFASSSSIYGDKEGKLKESDICDTPISPYAVSKKTVELLNYSYHINYNMNIINLRLFSVYGKNQRPDLVMSKFFYQLLHHQPIEIYGNGSTKRDYTYIDNVVSAFYNSIIFLQNNNHPIYEIINIGNGNPISLWQLLDYIKITIQNDNIQFQMQNIVKGDVKSTHADIEKAMKLLNYVPTVSIENGIKLFYEWFKAK